MGVFYKVKDIATVTKGLILHGVNCQGVMGSGVAKAVRAKWPIVYQAYFAYYRQHVYAEELPLESLLGDFCDVKISKSLYVYNCFTQIKYGKDGVRYASEKAIEACLTKIKYISQATGLNIYMPRIGCGLGGLDWDEDVLPIVRQAAYNIPDVYVLDLKE